MTLISETYRTLNRKLHERDDYGAIGARHANEVVGLGRATKSDEILDYGCGKGTLRKALLKTEFIVREYDPAVEGKDATPDPADMVVCTDVLEHIEPECLEDVLDDLERVTRKVAFLTVSTVPAEKTLEDGRNAHLIIKDHKWWLPRLWDRFEPVIIRFEPAEFLYVGRK